MNDILKNKEKLIEILALLSLFAILVVISYFHVEESIRLVRYLFIWGIKSLTDNYSLYHQSFQDFIFQTSAFHTADSEKGWRTLFYLLPLFIFSDALGGLSLTTPFLFTITTSLLLAVIFYLWIKQAWGKQVALYATFFLSFSSMFQELARAGNYHSYSLLIGLLWIAFFCYADRSKKMRDFFLLGLLTGITWYGYGILRYLTIVILLYILFLKYPLNLKALGMVFIGALFFLIPGFLIKLQLEHIDLSQHHKPLYQIFFNVNASFKGGHTLETIKENFGILGARLLGKERFLGAPQAPFWNPWLLIPLLIGVIHTIKSRRQPYNHLLLLLAFVIFLAPCVIVNHHLEPRRYFLCIIPAYCFIGLGIKTLITWVKDITIAPLKFLIVLLLIFIFSLILTQEITFFRTKIISSKRDYRGFLAFANTVKKENISGTLYCLERKGLFPGSLESDVIRLALMEKGKCPVAIISKKLSNSMPSIPKDSYLYKSPFLSQHEFDTWRLRHHLKVALILESPVKSTGKLKNKKFFKLYHIQDRANPREKI